MRLIHRAAEPQAFAEVARGTRLKPLTFSCEQTYSLAPEEIARRILDLTNWSDFHGYGPIPGIKDAVFEVQSPDIVGSRIRVTNGDGSSHIEEIVGWQPDRRLCLQLKEFSPPLSGLATKFEESWDFKRAENGTHVTRSFRLYAKSFLTRPLLRVVGFFLKKAIARHLRQLH